MAASYQQTFESDALATIFDVQTGSVAAIATDQAYDGTHSLKFHQTGGSSAAKRTLPGDGVMVHRFHLRVSALPGVDETVLAISDTPSGTTLVNVKVRSTGTVRIQMGATAQDSPVLSLDTWHAVDLRIDTSTSTYTVDWKVDGVDQTQVLTAGNAVAGQGAAQWCKSGANTFDWWVDQWQYGSTAADYPFADMGAGPTTDHPVLDSASASAAAATLSVHPVDHEVLASVSTSLASAVVRRAPHRLSAASQSVSASEAIVSAAGTRHPVLASQGASAAHATVSRVAQTRHLILNSQSASDAAATVTDAAGPPPTSGFLVDHFARTLSGSIGEADTGQSCAIMQGHLDQYAVDGALEVTLEAGRAPIAAYVVDKHEFDMRYDYAFDSLPAGSQQLLGPAFWLQSSRNYYRLSIIQTLSGHTNLLLEQQIEQVDVAVPMDWQDGNGPVTTQHQITPQVAGQKYHVRLLVQDDANGVAEFKVKVWADGDAEPDWMGIGSDVGGAPTTGRIGWRGQALAANTNQPTYSITDLVVVDPAGGQAQRLGWHVELGWKKGPGIFTIGDPAKPGSGSLIGGGDVLGGPFNEPSWEDVWDEVTVLSVDRGSGDATSEKRQGSFSLTLKDTTGKYNPRNSASPIADVIAPLRPCRAWYVISLAGFETVPSGFTDNGDGTASTSIWRGFVSDVSGPAGKGDPFASLLGVDLFERLNQEKPVIVDPGPTTTGGGIAAVLYAIGWRDATSLDTGDGIPGVYADGSKSALDIIGEMCVAEGGYFVIADDGTPTFVSHGGRTQLQAKITRPNVVRPGLSLDNVGNLARVTRTGADGTALGPEQTYQDGTSKTDYGSREVSGSPISTAYVVSDAQAAALAKRLVVASKDPRSPIWNLTLQKNDDAALFAILLGLDVGDRVSVNDPGSGTVGDFTIEGLKHDVSGGALAHTATWVLRQRPVGVFIIGQSVIGGGDVLAV